MRNRCRGPRVVVQVPWVELEIPRFEVEVPEVEARAMFRQPSSKSSPCRASRRSQTGDGLRRASRLRLPSQMTNSIGALQRLLKTCSGKLELSIGRPASLAGEMSHVPSRGGIPNSAPQAGEGFPFPKFPSPCPLAWEASPIPPPVPGRLSRPHPPRWRLKSQLCGTRMMMLLRYLLYCGRPAADPGIPLLLLVVGHVVRNVVLPQARRPSGQRRGGLLPLTGGAPVWPCTWQAANKQHPLCVEFGRAPVSEGPCGRA